MDYSDLKARLAMPWTIEEYMRDLNREALAAIEELEARVERAKAQLLLIAYGSTEASVSSVAKAIIAELETAQ